MDGVDVEMEVGAIAKFDNWDPRECAVDNKDQWVALANRFVEEQQGDCKIPAILHQIWIGPREPPCVWLDSFRIDFMAKYGRKAGFEYRLWDNDAAAGLEMVNRDLFDEEKMWQFKADILRLELMYQYGGIYVDSDVVSTGKDFGDILAMGKEHGFVITYEPDTKDKPYSVLGNSIFAATPRHPIVAMLILYIRTIYHHKRPHHGVEWVTGPLAYTKCLIHTKMPMSIPSSHLFYPQFHYVPNPSAIDIDAFPDAYAFQFGYTCSGLGDWVAQNNRCRKAAECYYHSQKTDWPLGPLLSLSDACPTDGAQIPKVIHQFAFQKTLDSAPHRWIRTWQKKFIAAHPDWTHRLWTLEELKSEGGGWFGANIYRTDRKMDPFSLKLLAVEVVNKFGGLYIPTSTIFNGNAPRNLFELNSSTGESFIESQEAGIFASPSNHIRTLNRIREIMDGNSEDQLGKFVPGFCESIQANVQGFSDSITAYLDFPQWTRFLAVEELYDMTMSAQTEEAFASWGYDGQIPVFHVRSNFHSVLTRSENRCIVITDPKLFRFSSLRDSLPSLITGVDDTNPDWDVLIISIEFETGENKNEHYRLASDVFSTNSMQFGYVFNFKRTNMLTEFKSPADLASRILLLKDDGAQVYVISEKHADTREMAAMESSIESIKKAFQTVANHEPPFEYTRTESHGHLLKMFRSDGSISMEMSTDDEGRVMYRSWNDDGGLNCEAKLDLGLGKNHVEWLRVYFNHVTITEVNNKSF